MWLPVVPQQEHPHEVHAERGDERQVVFDLGSVEFTPPAHRLASGPVVDAQAEGLVLELCCGCLASSQRHFSTPVITMPRMKNRCEKKKSRTGRTMPSSAVAWMRCGCCE